MFKHANYGRACTFIPQFFPLLTKMCPLAESQLTSYSSKADAEWQPLHAMDETMILMALVLQWPCQSLAKKENSGCFELRRSHG